MKKILISTLVLAALVSGPAESQVAPVDRYEALRRTSDTFDRTNGEDDKATGGEEFRAKCKSVGATDSFCGCLSARVPRALSFDQYVVVVTRTKEENAYGSMSREQKKTYDAVPAARDACASPGAP